MKCPTNHHECWPGNVRWIRLRCVHHFHGHGLTSRPSTPRLVEICRRLDWFPFVWEFHATNVPNCLAISWLLCWNSATFKNISKIEGEEATRSLPPWVIFSSSTSSFKAAFVTIDYHTLPLPDWNANKEFGEKTYRHMNRIEAPHMQSFMIQAFSAKDMTSAMLVKQNKFTSPRTGVWSVVESNIFENWTWENWRILRSQISSIHFSASIDIDFGAGGVQGTWHVDVPKSQVKGKHNFFASASIENPTNFEFFCLWRSPLSL